MDQAKEFPLPRKLAALLARAGYRAALVAHRTDESEMEPIDERAVRALVAGYEVDHEGVESSDVPARRD